MEFRTKVDIPKADFHISHKDLLLMIGSCFTENIGDYLHSAGFKIQINPFGIIYNPYSIFDNIKRIAIEDLYTEEDFVHYNELYLSLDHHGSFSGTDKQNVLDKINREIKTAHENFIKSEFILLTLGTSFIYFHKEKNKIVANCHKIPGTAFEKRWLNIQEIEAAFEDISPYLQNKKIIFTISPVRHWRDGATQNLRSKSILIEAVQRVLQKHANCFYFPAYEIVMDELRDYRFYEADMLHPNKVAIQYIWKRFGDTYFSPETASVNKRIEEIRLLLQHRIKHHDTKAESDFRKHTEQTIASFQKDYPEIELNFLPFSGSSINIGNSI